MLDTIDTLLKVGGEVSFKETVLFDWVVYAAFPAKSYIADELDGTTVRVSDPFGVPEIVKPNVYSLPDGEIVDGVLLILATPPLIDKAKSLISIEPLPPFVL